MTRGEDRVLCASGSEERGDDVLEFHACIVVEEVGSVGIHVRPLKALISENETRPVHHLVSRIGERRMCRDGRLLFGAASDCRERAKKYNTASDPHQTTPARIRSWRCITPTIWLLPLSTGIAMMPCVSMR